MPSAANVTAIVIRLISSVISFTFVSWFIVYLKRRMELQNIFQKKFLLVTILRGIFGGLSNIPGALMLSCISSETDSKNLVLSFFQSLFVILVIDGHTIALYIRSCDIVDAKTRKIIRYLMIMFFIASFGVVLSAFILIFIPIDDKVVPFDPVRCAVKNPGEVYMGMVSGALIFIIDCTFMYHFVQYLRKTRQLLGNSQSDVLALISQEAIKILAITFIAFIGFAIYSMVPGDVGTVSFLFLEFSNVVGFLLWIRLKYMLDHRESHIKQISNATNGIHSVKTSTSEKVALDFSSDYPRPFRGSQSSPEAPGFGSRNIGGKSRLDVSMNQSFEYDDITPTSEDIQTYFPEGTNM